MGTVYEQPREGTDQVHASNRHEEGIIVSQLGRAPFYNVDGSVVVQD